MQQLMPQTLLNGGTYKIERMLGQGSFGITYLATHTAPLAKKVAIKEFFMKDLNGRSEDGSITGMSDGSLSMDYARKFQKKAPNLARLEHPNIVRVTDSFEDNGTFYYVMDYIEGENLNDYLKHNHVSAQEAVSIIRDVAEALRYMHEEKHMLHLDLKPGNVMRRASDGHIFLIDFGLSKHYSSTGQPETSPTIGLGTAGYAPIEQAKNGEFRPTIDVYALGATLYKLLTRETPPAAFELVFDDELLTKNLTKYGINHQLSHIVVRAMLPNVMKRTQSVRDFLDSLPYGATDNMAEHTHVYVSDDEETIVNSQPAQEETKVETSTYSAQTPKSEEAEHLSAGTILNDGAYRVEVMLGQGSFGITYLATHTALDKKMTIKEFFMKGLNGRSEDGSITGMSDGSLSMDYARKFQKEALNLARLEHPNIVRVTDFFEDNGTFP